MNLINQSIGRYSILEHLAEGGMSTVYKAFDTQLNRDVAIKLIRRSAFKPTELDNVLKRFDREAKALAKLDHANILKVHDFGEYNSSPYLVLEYIPGGTLKQKLLGQPWPWKNAASMLMPIASALKYAHENGIIHRDVKPSNILLDSDNQALLTDFGIAKILEAGEGQTLSTATGVGIGTPEYMAPEQGLGQKVDVRADIYSMGIVLYEMITGRRPFEADTPMGVVVKQINEPLPRPREIILNLPLSVENVLRKALAKKPTNRYQSMEEFAVALEMLIRTEQDVNEPVTQNSIEGKVAPRGKRRRPAFLLGLAALLLMVGVFFTIIGFGLPVQIPFVQSSPTKSFPQGTDISLAVTQALKVIYEDMTQTVQAKIPTPTFTQTPIPTATPIFVKVDDQHVNLSRITSENADNLDVLMRIETGKGVQDILFSPDGSMLAMIRNNGTIQLWDLINTTLLNTYKAEGAISAALFEANNILIASCSDYAGCEFASKSELHSWQISPQVIKNIGEHDGVAIAMSHDRKAILRTFLGKTSTYHVWTSTCQFCTITGKKYRFELWDLTSDPPKMLESLGDATISQGSPIASAFSMDGKNIELRFNATSLAFSPDGALLAVGGGLHRVDGVVYHKIDLGNGIFVSHGGTINDMEFSPDGTFLASAASDRTARIWKVSDGLLLKTLEGHSIDVIVVAFSPNSILIATYASTSTEVVIWGVRSSNASGIAPIQNSIEYLESTPTKNPP